MTVARRPKTDTTSSTGETLKTDARYCVERPFEVGRAPPPPPQV